jgi:hypothetical protein
MQLVCLASLLQEVADVIGQKHVTEALYKALYCIEKVNCELG